MYRILIFIFISVFLFCEEKYFNLKDILEYAIKNNPQILMNNKEIEGEELNIEIEKANKMPHLEFLSSANRFKYPYPIIPISFEGGKLVIPEFDKSFYNFGINLQFPLYKGGRLNEAVYISQIKKDIKKAIFKTKLEDLKYAIGNLYFTILKMEKLKKSVEFSIQQKEIHKKNAENFYIAGSVPKIDLLKAEIELKKAEENLLILNNNIQIYFEILKSAIGFEGEEIKIKEEFLFEDLNLSPENALKEAFLNRPELKEIGSKKELTERKIEFLKGKKFPEISFASDYFLNTGGSFNFEENWALGLKLKFPVFEGGKTKLEIKKEEIEREKLKEEERGLKIQIEREVKEAFLNLQNAKKRIEVLKDAIEESKENLRLEQILYQAGSNTSKDVIDAENFLLQIETSYWEAIFDKEMAILNLFKAMGYDLLEILNKEL